MQKSDDNQKADDDELLAALGSLYPRKGLPVALSAGYQDTGEQGTVLNVSTQLARAAFDFGARGEGRKALVDVAGAAIDDRGRIGSFKQLLTITPDAAGDGSQPFIWHQRLRLKPGLYQVRVALRDRATGRTGSAMQWVEIPDPKKKTFFLSSLFVGERVPAEGPPPAAEAPEEALMRGVTLTADRRLARTSWLRFVTFIYNAKKGAPRPDVALQVQVFRDDQPFLTTPLRKIETRDVPDIARIPYAAEIPLNTFPVGRYVLQVTAIDRAAKASASQRVNFSVE
jgi:hypothetical protein